MFAAATVRTTRRSLAMLGFCIALLLFALSFGVLAAQPVGATAPQAGVGGTQIGTSGVTDGSGVTDDTKSKTGGPKNSTQSTQKTQCQIIEGPQQWYNLTGEHPGADWVGGMYCSKS